MYQYSEADRTLVEERAQQFRNQVARRLAGELKEDEFKPLRLQNGLYLQLHAYMLRVAVPYGLLSSDQLRCLAHIARRYDRGYGHFTTRQNIQYNWLALSDVPSILDDLAKVEMHAIQTSGNCIRNITSDPLAGVAADEIEDPRPYCELIRQWSTFHPEFAFLPRKFKIAVTGAQQDRAAILLHDIGLRLTRRGASETATAGAGDPNEIGFEVFVGGGQGRTPLIAQRVHPFLEKRHLLPYLEAILRVYNRFGRRDNKYKARIKIQVKAVGAEHYRKMVEEEFGKILQEPRGTDGLELTPETIERMKAYFVPTTESEHSSPAGDPLASLLLSRDRTLASFVKRNVVAHRHDGYVAVTLSLKGPDLPPGDVTAEQMDAVANLADQFSLGRLRVTHRQNLVFTDVAVSSLPALHQALCGIGLGAANVGTVTDIIACPGLDYCNLANARSISVARAVQEVFSDPDLEELLGEVTVNISGCINACGHHHVGNIGILGIDKQGSEFYQLMLGGSAMDDASLGKILGKALTHDEIAPALKRVLDTYLGHREHESEPFLATYRRVGAAPFKEAVYGAD